MATTDVLRGVPLFSGMTDRAIEAIAGLTTEATFADGETLVREGDPGETFMVLVDGSARVERATRPIAELGAATSSVRSPSSTAVLEPRPSWLAVRSRHWSSAVRTSGASTRNSGPFDTTS